LASLQARSSLRSAHPLIVVNKVVSLTAFMVLLASGWVAVNYLKTELTGPSRAGNETAGGSGNPVANAAAVPDSSPDPKAARPAVRLVYACAGDTQFYHCSTHLPSQCDRTAMSEEAALRRGLKRCATCFPQ
jgi:hypothetical protein